MRKLACALLLIGSSVFATTRSEDLKVILEKTFLQPQCDPLLNMVAMEAIGESEKKIESDVLVEKFKTILGEEKILAQFAKPFENLFSDSEIAELRKMHENAVWQKYSKEGMNIFQAQMENMQATFKELVANFDTNEKAVVALGDVMMITKDNANVISNSKKPMIIDVQASWCHSCQMLSPIMDELSEQYKDKIQFAKIDMDADRELADQYGVTALPTVLFIKPGQKTPVMKSVGFISKKDFDAKINEFMKKK